MIARVRNESGQAVLVTVLFLTVIVGAVALTIDVGAWYREQRQAQATADAAALAGAQALPTDPAQATALAQHYADVNGGGVLAAGITFRSDFRPNDTIMVNDARTAPSFFSRVFSIDSVTVHGSATARAGVPQQAKYVAPIVVSKLHPDLSGPGCPCFDQQTTLPLSKTGAPGAFGLVNLDPASNNPGSSTLADWVQNGFDQYLALGSYDSAPGAKFNSTQIGAALQARVGTELLFPVYAPPVTGGGSNAQYTIIGWVAFHLQCVGTYVSGVCSGNNGNSQNLTGYFTRVIWDGIQSSKNLNLPDFGTYSVTLIN